MSVHHLPNQVCPCETNVPDPGPHIPSCPYNDPNYGPEPPDPREVRRAMLERMKSQGAAMTEPWDHDLPLPEDDEIRAAHPLKTGRHDLHHEALRLVGAKHSKAALVALVNWLLFRLESARNGGRNPGAAEGEQR